jgi:hypothetical protein
VKGERVEIELARAAPPFLVLEYIAHVFTSGHPRAFTPHPT